MSSPVWRTAVVFHDCSDEACRLPQGATISRLFSDDQWDDYCPHLGKQAGPCQQCDDPKYLAYLASCTEDFPGAGCPDYDTRSEEVQEWQRQQWEAEHPAAWWVPVISFQAFPPCVACHGDFIRPGTITATFGPGDGGDGSTDAWCPRHLGESLEEHGYCFINAKVTEPIA